MRRHALAMVTALCATRCSGGASKPPAAPPEPTVLGQLEALTSTDQIGPGGWDMKVTSRSRRIFAPRLSDCAEPVARATTAWADANTLSVTKNEVDRGLVRIHVGDTGLGGYYEVVYHLDTEGHRATISFLYWDKHADASEPATHGERATKLMEQLQAAIKCGAE